MSNEMGNGNIIDPRRDAEKVNFLGPRRNAKKVNAFDLWRVREKVNIFSPRKGTENIIWWLKDCLGVGRLWGRAQNCSGRVGVVRDGAAVRGVGSTAGWAGLRRGAGGRRGDREGRPYRG